ncbi:Glutamine amidotransferase type-1 domain-containing protein [Mycena sanguinolenta]|uniref:Glutamine amidotransferase type-1 domain-containing protein n=1 Tax=Mycena sanguinolenta TaxID=230812 RepID=A0A8H7DMD7_9AGAR|nr:Glutamine amidotransferase type-1 domain-containing protein [Mycena sanguinolenta]
MSKSIALLICDTPMPSVVEEHGDYHVLFTNLLHAAGKQLGIDEIADKCKLDPYDVVTKMEYPTDEQLEAYDGILITGSKANACDDIEWINKLVEYTTRVATAKPNMKIVGICFGHQIVARALGGRCVRNDKWEVGPTPVTLSPLGKEVFGVDLLVILRICTLVGNIDPDPQYIQEMHRDHVPEVPDNFHLLGSTDISMNQGMVRFHSAAAPTSPVSLSDIHIFTVQGHPEFDEPVVTKLTNFRTAQGIIDSVTAADAARRAKWQNDGVGIVGKVILGVYGVE